jgi:hypothetical protein
MSEDHTVTIKPGKCTPFPLLGIHLPVATLSRRERGAYKCRAACCAITSLCLIPLQSDLHRLWPPLAFSQKLARTVLFVDLTVALTIAIPHGCPHRCALTLYRTLTLPSGPSQPPLAHLQSRLTGHRAEQSCKVCRDAVCRTCPPAVPALVAFAYHAQHGCP